MVIPNVTTIWASRVSLSAKREKETRIVPPKTEAPFSYSSPGHLNRGRLRLVRTQPSRAKCRFVFVSDRATIALIIVVVVSTIPDPGLPMSDSHERIDRI